MKISILKFNNYSKLQICFFIFFLSLIVRVFIINFINTHYIPIDGIGYYEIAKNVADGNGYTLGNGLNFLREPGYPLFLVGAF